MATAQNGTIFQKMPISPPESLDHPAIGSDMFGPKLEPSA